MGRRIEFVNISLLPSRAEPVNTCSDDELAVVEAFTQRVRGLAGVRVNAVAGACPVVGPGKQPGVQIERVGGSIRVTWTGRPNGRLIERSIHVVPRSGQTARDALNALRSGLPEASVLE